MLRYKVSEALQFGLVGEVNILGNAAATWTAFA